MEVCLQVSKLGSIPYCDISPFSTEKAPNISVRSKTSDGNEQTKSVQGGKTLQRMSFNPLTPKSDWHLFSPYKITPDSNIKVMRIREMINKKKLLIVKQILFFRTLRNV